MRERQPPPTAATSRPLGKFQLLERLGLDGAIPPRCKGRSGYPGTGSAPGPAGSAPCRVPRSGTPSLPPLARRSSSLLMAATISSSGGNSTSVVTSSLSRTCSSCLAASFSYSRISRSRPTSTSNSSTTWAAASRRLRAIPETGSGLAKAYRSGERQAMRCIRQLHPRLRGRAHTNDRNDVTDAESRKVSVSLADAQVSRRHTDWLCAPVPRTQPGEWPGDHRDR